MSFKDWFSLTDKVSAYGLFVGVIRLVQYLSQNHVFGKEQALKIVIDAGTGTTAIGFALGAIFLGCVPNYT